jgi:hypothetical protein
MPDEFEYYKIGAALLGGGLAGSILTNCVTVYRSRVQPVGKRVEVFPLFTQSYPGAKLKAEIMITNDVEKYVFGNLYIADIQIGNKDYESFAFGVTLSNSDSAIHVETIGADRHHTVTLAKPVNLKEKTSDIDIVLKPFSRQDSYSIKVLIVAKNEKPGNVTMSSAAPVRFTDMPTISEAIVDAASRVDWSIMGIGGILMNKVIGRIKK